MLVNLLSQLMKIQSNNVRKDCNMNKKFKNSSVFVLCFVLLISTILPGMDYKDFSFIAKADSNTVVEFTELKHFSISGDSHASVNDEGAEAILTFKRNYVSANTWSGGALQLKTDNNESYKLQPATSYRVKFDYCVESYNEASDAQYKDLSVMVATSKAGEGTFTNARSVTARDLDSLTASHRANEAATSGDYAAVGARVPYNAAGYGCTSGSHNWQNVTAEFTTRDSLTTASGTFDILTIGIVSHKVNAGDIQVSFKNVSVEVVDLSGDTPEDLPASFSELKHFSISGDSHASVNDEGAEAILTFKRNYASANTWSGGAIQLKTDNNEFYKLQPATSYRVKFDYCVESYNEASNAEFKDLSIMVATSQDGEGTFYNARSVTSRDLDSLTASHRANEAATSGDYAAVGARVPYNAAGYGCTSGSHNWQNVTAEFTTQDSLTTSSGTYDILTIGIVCCKKNGL